MTDKMQKLMNQAYDRWQANPTWTKARFWVQLDYKEKIAVFFGNLNYQVTNGGWQQWAGNEYMTDESVKFIRLHLEEMDTEVSKKVLQLLNTFAKLVDDLGGNVNRIDDHDWDDFSAGEEPLNAPFYEVNDQLMAEVEAKYLS